MCSQPPKEVNDSHLVEENLKMLSLIQASPEYMGMTGGEPTLFGPDLIRLLEAAKEKLPATHLPHVDEWASVQRSCLRPPYC